MAAASLFRAAVSLFRAVVCLFGFAVVAPRVAAAATAGGVSQDIRKFGNLFT